MSAETLRADLLLRWSQAGIVLCGLALIAIGSGRSVPWLAAILTVALSGVVAGLIYEVQQRRRGAGDGAFAVLLPLAGGVSGIYALMAAA